MFERTNNGRIGHEAEILRTPYGSVLREPQDERMVSDHRGGLWPSGCGRHRFSLGIGFRGCQGRGVIAGADAKPWGARPRAVIVQTWRVIPTFQARHSGEGRSPGSHRWGPATDSRLFATWFFWVPACAGTTGVSHPTKHEQLPCAVRWGIPRGPHVRNGLDNDTGGGGPAGLRRRLPTGSGPGTSR